MFERTLRLLAQTRDVFHFRIVHLDSANPSEVSYKVLSLWCIIRLGLALGSKLFAKTMKTTARFIVVFMLIALVVALGKNIVGQASKFKEIYQAETEIRQFTKENQELQNKLKKEQNSFFLEKQSRDKLGYQKQGETLYVVDTKESRERETKEEPKENWQEWLGLILK